MGHFAKVGKAEVTQKSGFFPLGKHRIRVAKFKVHTGHKGTNLILEGTCVRTDAAPEVLKVGQTRAQVINLGNVMGPINTKALVLALSGVEPTDPDGGDKAVAIWEALLEENGMDFEDVCDRLTDEEAQLIIGLELELECTNTKTQAGKDFTVHRWYPCTEDELLACVAG